MAEQAASEARATVRALVVYRYPVYRDLITRVLEKAEVEVAAALPVKELDRQTMLTLRPDVVVIYDPDANNLLREVAASTVMDSAGNDVRRVVCVGSDNEMIVLNRLVFPNPSVEGLVGWVKGLPGDQCRRWRSETGPSVDSAARPEEQTTGSGGS